jgi:hypothetical protein
MTVSASSSPIFPARQSEMVSTDLQPGAMMVREGFLLPDSAHLQTRSYSSTWRSLIGVDGFALDQKLREAGLHLFYIAGELKVVELGWGASATRRGMNRILAGGSKLNLNCMQIKQVTSARFLGIPYVAIRACSHHIQKDSVLESKAERTLEQRDRDWACGYSATNSRI